VDSVERISDRCLAIGMALSRACGEGWVVKASLDRGGVRLDLSKTRDASGILARISDAYSFPRRRALGRIAIAKLSRTAASLPIGIVASVFAESCGGRVHCGGLGASDPNMLRLRARRGRGWIRRIGSDDGFSPLQLLGTTGMDPAAGRALSAMGAGMEDGDRRTVILADALEERLSSHERLDLKMMQAAAGDDFPALERELSEGGAHRNFELRGRAWIYLLEKTGGALILRLVVLGGGTSWEPEIMCQPLATASVGKTR